MVCFNGKISAGDWKARELLFLQLYWSKRRQRGRVCRDAECASIAGRQVTSTPVFWWRVTRALGMKASELLQSSRLSLKLCREKIIQSHRRFQEPKYCFHSSSQPPKCHFSPQKKTKPRSNLGLAPELWNRGALATGSAGTGHVHARLRGGCPPSKAPAAHQKHQATSRERYHFYQTHYDKPLARLVWDTAVCPSH